MINYIIGSLFVFTLDDGDTSQRAILKRINKQGSKNSRSLQIRNG